MTDQPTGVGARDAYASNNLAKLRRLVSQVSFGLLDPPYFCIHVYVCPGCTLTSCSCAFDQKQAASAFPLLTSSTVHLLHYYIVLTMWEELKKRQKDMSSECQPVWFWNTQVSDLLTNLFILSSWLQCSLISFNSTTSQAYWEVRKTKSKKQEAHHIYPYIHISIVGKCDFTSMNQNFSDYLS